MSSEAATEKKHIVTPMRIWVLCFVLSYLLISAVGHILQYQLLVFKDAKWTELSPAPLKKFNILNTDANNPLISDEMGKRLWVLDGKSWRELASVSEQSVGVNKAIYYKDQLYITTHLGELYKEVQGSWKLEVLPREDARVSDLELSGSGLLLSTYEGEFLEKTDQGWNLVYQPLFTTLELVESILPGNYESGYALLGVELDINSGYPESGRLFVVKDQVYLVGAGLSVFQDSNFVTVLESHGLSYPTILGEFDSQLWLADEWDVGLDYITKLQTQSLVLNSLVGVNLETGERTELARKAFYTQPDVVESISFVGASKHGLLIKRNGQLEIVNPKQPKVSTSLASLPKKFYRIETARQDGSGTIIASAVVDRGMLSVVADSQQPLALAIGVIQFIAFWMIQVFERRKKKLAKKLYKSNESKSELNAHSRHSFEPTLSAGPNSAPKTGRVKRKLSAWSFKLFEWSVLVAAVVVTLVVLGQFEVSGTITSIVSMVVVVFAIVIFKVIPLALIWSPLKDFNYAKSIKRAEFWSQFDALGADEMLGTVHMFRGDIASARKAFSEQIDDRLQAGKFETSEQITSLLAASARCSMIVGELEQALGELEKASAISETHSEIPLTYAEVYLLQEGRLEDARKKFDQAKGSLNVLDAFFFNDKLSRLAGVEALVLAEEGELEKAEAVLLKALSVDKQQYGPESALLLLRAGIVYRKFSKHSQADDYFRKAAQLDANGYIGRLARQQINKKTLETKPVQMTSRDFVQRPDYSI